MSSSSGTPNASGELQGLDLAQQKFGPLLSPVAATPRAWTRYALSRERTVQVYNHRTVINIKPGKEDEEEDKLETLLFRGNESGIIRRKISARVEELEREMKLPLGTFVTCISMLNCYVLLEDFQDPRDCNIIARIYSPSTPACIDVSFRHHFRARAFGHEWNYSLGYKIHRRPAPEAPDGKGIIRDLKENNYHHTKDGWRTISTGYYDEKNVERGEVYLGHEDVFDICDLLLGPIDEPDQDAPEDEKIAFRRRLVWCVRLLMASVGIGYKMACVDSEEDDGVSTDMRWLVENYGNWFARGIRKACGFELTRDAEEAQQFREYQKEQEEEARSGGGFDDEDMPDFFAPGFGAALLAQLAMNANLQRDAGGVD
ncbi:hypothetical protein CONPUDRAFT_168400 [Coniophora puteana RWD-64-598 SS2]|uniref:Uncharacterized protein n=1 Tax=Coniophora puteana (strain RWD-64-598) TaxID=741705 RepID=A0A5M3MBD1_CONPW|nr:uncharacterized protein CONPUDRAFT_168400 [Coniophora puteana RWD-64-598 SS2]EIW76548.1 hypothetical protein CONPUDRAFT_168400 [Coniophora puteana RWD-64-598 SS2]